MRKLLLIGAAALMMAACGLPFGLGRPSTSQLENGAADNLANATSFEAMGTFSESSTNYTFDTKYVKPSTEDILVTQGTLNYEVLQIGGKVYFKGNAYLSSVLTSPDAQQILKAVGDRWFTTSTAQLVDTSAITDANKVKANFLTTIAAQRTDDVVVDGQKTAELTLSDFILNITESSPYRLVRLRSVSGKAVSGVSDFDMKFTNYGQDFGIQQPTNVFDLDDPTTWPPLYQVDSVTQVVISGTTSCNDPCVLNAIVENAGGVNGASAPSTVTFTLTSDTDNSTLGSCKVTIQPDRPHGQKFNVSCTIQSAAWTNFTGNYHYKADIDNPAYD
jgi:hypothetical protein